MTSCFSKEIGGYFGLDIFERFNNVGSSIALNSARYALQYVIKAYGITEIYIPYYTCPVVWQTLQREKCKIKFYHIDKNFMPVCNFNENDYVLYTNYFGICAKNVKSLADKYKNLIVDNAQAFYMPKYGIASFNSIRKFFGIPDGSLLYSDKTLNDDLEQDTSYKRCSHLLKRIDVNATFGYNDFIENDDSLIDETIKRMSNLTTKIFNSINIENAKIKRLENFNFLHKHLSNTNELNISLDVKDVPMVYPYLINDEKLRSKLIKNKIYVATYWNPMPENLVEGNFQKYLLPLPIDQRYCVEDMKRMIEVIKCI